MSPRLLVLATAAVACCALALPAGASASHCGSISSSKFGSISHTTVFTYKYPSCRRARLIIRGYLRKLTDVMSCQQQTSCTRIVRGWKCHVPGVHGTWVGCVPKGSPWSGPGRPFVGVDGY